jgi:hypothetical protein
VAVVAVRMADEGLRGHSINPTLNAQSAQLAQRMRLVRKAGIYSTKARSPELYSYR